MGEREVSVYGGFPARVGLAAVRDALAAGFPAAEVSIDDLGGPGPTLCFRAGPVFFSTTAYIPDEDVFLFDGGVPGPLDEAIGFVRRLSGCLAAAGLEHDFHVASGPMEYAASFAYPPETGAAEPLYGHIRINKDNDSGRVSGDDVAS